MLRVQAEGPIGHFQSRLLRLMEGVREQREEHTTLRAEVLLSLNHLGSAALMLELWQSLERVGAREEMLLVRLLGDMDSGSIDRLCGEMLGAAEENQRSVAYAILALRGEAQSASLLVKALEREPLVVLKRAGRRHLAPYSFYCCVFAGVRELKDERVRRMVPALLRRFGEGTSELDCVAGMLDSERPEEARLGFMVCATLFMGKMHNHAYDDVLCGAPRRLVRAERRWLQRALCLTPEVIDVILEPGPLGLDGADFVRARAAVIKQLDANVTGKVAAGLIRGEIPLRTVSEAEQAAKKSKELGYLLSLLVGERAGLAELVPRLKDGGEVESDAVIRMLELSTGSGAINSAVSAVAHWFETSEADAEQRPFWRWCNSLWRDDRHVTIAEALDAALSSPDETAMYAASIVAATDEPLGRFVRALISGHQVDLGVIAPLVDHGAFVPVVRACLRNAALRIHPLSCIALARSGLTGLQAALRARLEASGEDEQRRQALGYAHRLVVAARFAQSHPLYRQLCDLGLQPLDREIESLEQVEARNPERPALKAMRSVLGERALLSIYFWLPKSSLPQAVGVRPASGYAARAELVIDLSAGRVQYAAWFDRAGREHTGTRLAEDPACYRTAFGGIPWFTPVENLPEAIVAADGVVIANAPLYSPVSRRILARLGVGEVRLDTDELGRFQRALGPTGERNLDAAIARYVDTFGPPLFRTDSAAVWRFKAIEISVRPDSAFDSLAWAVAATP